MVLGDSSLKCFGLAPPSVEAHCLTGQGKRHGNAIFPLLFPGELCPGKASVAQVEAVQKKGILSLGHNDPRFSFSYRQKQDENCGRPALLLS